MITNGQSSAVALHLERIEMPYALSEAAVTKLKELAETKCWSDDPDFMTDDYAGGNIDDAYAGGERAGEILMARWVLGELGILYTIPD